MHTNKHTKLKHLSPKNINMLVSSQLSQRAPAKENGGHPLARPP